MTQSGHQGHTLAVSAQFLKVVNFEQTFVAMHARLRAAAGARRGIMAVSKNDTHKDYVRYAEHCLAMVTAAADQDSRVIQHEMAAEWLKLANDVRRRSRPKQMQME